MFTVRNTLFGAVVCALGVWVPLVEPLGGPEVDGFELGFAASCTMMHVWFLLGHLHLKRVAGKDRPAVGPASAR